MQRVQLIAVILVLFGAVTLPRAGLGQSEPLTIWAKPQLVASGLLGFILPRYGLKHNRRVVVVDAAEGATLRLGAEGTPVFSGLGRIWALSHGGTEDGAAFEAWLLSDVGRGTVEAFTIDGATPFNADFAVEPVTVDTVFLGDAERGLTLAHRHCGRCHVIDASNRMKGMGATPSFGALKTLPDWEGRFQAFYALKPHPSFTQVEGVTLPFHVSRPSAIVPLELTLKDLEDIVAFAARVPPADLGAPLHSQ